MLILSHKDVQSVLTMPDCIAAVDEGMRALAKGEYFQPLRMKAVPEGSPNRMVFMPALRLGGDRLWGLKEIVVTPDNSAVGLDSHQGAVLLHDGDTGELVAAVHAGAITAIRTAAASAVATRALARSGSRIVTVLGAGVQGTAHLDAMRCIFPGAELRVWSRTPARAASVAAASVATVMPSLAAACRDADVICAVTAARQPILTPETVSPGCHINAVGSSIASTREIDSALMEMASLFVDRRESTLNEAGDYLFAVRERGLTPAHIQAEIGEVLIGSHPGRRSGTEITLYKSLGIGVQDLVAAETAYRKAQAAGVGTVVEF